MAALLNADGRSALGSNVQVHAPHLLDSEVASAIRSRVRRGKLDSRAGWDLLERYRRLGITRHGTFSMLDRVWELRHNLSAYDASYVALAEALQCRLLSRETRGSVERLACAAR